jgi:hypothetical protein
MIQLSKKLATLKNMMFQKTVTLCLNTSLVSWISKLLGWVMLKQSGQMWCSP